MTAPTTIEDFARETGLGNEWKIQAKCRDLDPFTIDTMFFPSGTKNDPLKEKRERMCSSCPVQRQCEEYGNASRDTYGAWGGYFAGDRKRRRRWVS